MEVENAYIPWKPHGIFLQEDPGDLWQCCLGGWGKEGGHLFLTCSLVGFESLSCVCIL